MQAVIPSDAPIAAASTVFEAFFSTFTFTVPRVSGSSTSGNIIFDKTKRSRSCHNTCSQVNESQTLIALQLSSNPIVAPKD